MSLKPWSEISRPHKDVLEGSFKQSEFAADITQVATGTAPEEYQRKHCTNSAVAAGSTPAG